MQKPYAVIFDMDGVIFDSERAVYQCWIELGKKYGLHDLDIPYYRSIGTNQATNKKIFEEFYGTEVPFEKIKAEQSALYHQRYDGGRLPKKPGIDELLAYLKEKQIYTAIASSTRRVVIENQIRDAGFSDCFQKIVAGNEVEKSKPFPDIFLKAKEGTALPPEQVFVIEDSYNGIRAAHAAGMIPIMVPDMLEPDEEMREKAAYICKDLFEVKELLVKLSAE